MSNFEIHELTEKAINRNSNIVHDTLENGSYATGKNLAGAVADLANANVAAPYDSTVTYAIGQYCLYEGDIYRCIAITTGAFDSTAWVQIVVTGEFRRVVELTSAQYTALTSAEKNNGTLYIITDEETTAADIPYSAGVSVADKLATIPTSESVSITFNSSQSDYTMPYNNTHVEKYGNVVSVSIVPKCVNSYSTYPGQLVYTGLPTPKETIYYTFTSALGNGKIRLSIDTSGNLYLRWGNVNDEYDCTFTYVCW